MNKIKNVKLENNILAFEYIPENSGNVGFVNYDIEKDEFININPSKSDNKRMSYAKKATWFLLDEIENDKELQEEYLQMWY